MTDISLEQLERFGYTLVIMLVVVLPVMIAVTRRVMSQMADRDQALKEQRTAHNKERETLTSLFQTQIAEERAYGAAKDARNGVLSDRVYEISQAMTQQAEKYAESTIKAVGLIRGEMQAELVSLGTRMRVAEGTAERAESRAATAESRDEECRRRLGELERRIDTQERHTV